jgi:hypothetical protein
MYLDGSLSIQTDILKRTLYGAGTLKRILFSVNATGVNSQIGINMTLNGSVQAGVVLTGPLFSSVTSSLQINELDVLAVSIVSLSGQAEGLNVTAWVEYV